MNINQAKKEMVKIADGREWRLTRQETFPFSGEKWVDYGAFIFNEDNTVWAWSCLKTSLNSAVEEITAMVEGFKCTPI